MKELFHLTPFISPQERDHNSEDEDEDKYADDIDMPGQNFDSKRRITVRNLRIREDIAKVSKEFCTDVLLYSQELISVIHSVINDFVYGSRGLEVKVYPQFCSCSRYNFIRVILLHR